MMAFRGQGSLLLLALLYSREENLTDATDPFRSWKKKREAVKEKRRGGEAGNPIDSDLKLTLVAARVLSSIWIMFWDAWQTTTFSHKKA